MITLYGISNCDTVKKARSLLDSRSITYQYHDFRKDGLQSKQINVWLKDLGVDTLVNKRSRTWKQLSEKQQSSLTSAKAAKLIVENPTLIKRPLLEVSKDNATVTRIAGFDEDQYLALCS